MTAVPPVVPPVTDSPSVKLPVKPAGTDSMVKPAVVYPLPPLSITILSTES